MFVWLSHRLEAKIFIKFLCVVSDEELEGKNWWFVLHTIMVI